MNRQVPQGRSRLPASSAKPPSTKKAAAGVRDFVVVYYRAKITGTDASGKAQILIRDFIHTWAASPAVWRIIGEMCRFEDPVLRAIG